MYFADPTLFTQIRDKRKYTLLEIQGASRPSF